MWTSKYAKIRFRPGALPRNPLGGAHTLSPTLCQQGRGHSSLYRAPFGTDPPSVLAKLPPQNSSQIYAYGYREPLRLLTLP